MTFVLLFLTALLLFTGLYLRFLAVPAVWRWLRASDLAGDPVWERVRECAARVARRHRVAEPALKVLPEFAPNALLLRHRGRAELGLTEGLVRALDADELEAAISLAFFQGAQAGRRRRAWSGLLLFPFAKRVAEAPFAVRIFLAPVISFLVRAAGRDSAWYSADAQAAALYGPWQVAATLQKLSVIGRKIPVRRWNLALDSFFVVAPLALDEGPHWLVHGQPSVQERRERLLAGAAP